jgi:hypothetical protein
MPPTLPVLETPLAPPLGSVVVEIEPPTSLEPPDAPEPPVPGVDPPRDSVVVMLTTPPVPPPPDAEDTSAEQAPNAAAASETKVSVAGRMS